MKRVKTHPKSIIFLNSVIQDFVKRIPSNAPVKIAFSGGLDSSVLLHLLSQNDLLKTRLSAHYIDHGLQDNSSHWANHCLQVCHTYGVPCVVTKVSVTKTERQGVESTARKLRYQALVENVSEDSILLMAHHQRDQAETVLLNLARGAGVSGVSGIPYAREIKHGEVTVQLFRPLLRVAYQSLLDYAEYFKLQWVEDPSNQQLTFRRNTVRHVVLESFKSTWPNIDKSLAQTADNLSEAKGLLDRLAVLDLAEQSTLPMYLSLGRLKVLDWPAQKNCIRFWIEKRFNLTLSIKHYQWIKSVLDCEGQSKQGAYSYQLSIGELRFNKLNLAYLKEKPVEYECTLKEYRNWQGLVVQPDRSVESALNISAYSWSLPRLNSFKNSSFKVRNIRQSDDIKRKKLKGFFQAHEIPLWERQVWPVLEYDGAVVSVLGCKHCTQSNALNVERVTEVLSMASLHQLLSIK